MAAQAPLNAEEIGELETANGDLSDRAALEARWKRDGYYFFRGIIEQGELDVLRAPVLAALKDARLIAPDADGPHYNGAGLAQFPTRRETGYDALAGLTHRNSWRRFFSQLRITEMFADIFGRTPYWLPVAEYRVTPPGEPEELGLLNYPHQDGFYNEGYLCTTAWIPLWDVPRIAGGLAVASGMHRGERYLHDVSRPPRFPIPEDAIAPNAWRTTDYRAGDLIIFDRYLPHSGMRNHSGDRFRCSFDIRCVLGGDPAPLVGVVEQAYADRLDVKDERGGTRTVKLAETTFCREPNNRAGRVPMDRVCEVYKPGQEVFITLDGDTAILVREPKY